MAKSRRGFASVRKLPSGRYQARVSGPDLVRRPAPYTFATKQDAEAWAADQRRAMTSGTWSVEPPTEPKPELTVAEWAEAWLSYSQARPDRPIRARTAEQYRSALDREILPVLGNRLLADVTTADVRNWYAGLGSDRPTWRAICYRVLRALMRAAVADDLITASPCKMPGAAVARRKRDIEPATVRELDEIAAAMPERLRLAVDLAAWCALRFGELIELRRGDIDLRRHVIRVRRAAVRVGGRVLVGEPKSDAGRRDITIPPHLLPAVRKHLQSRVNGRDGLLFPAADGVSHLADSTLYRHYGKARAAAGRADLRWHDLRHTSAVMAAQAGATLAELQGRLGHSSAAAALIYQHAADGRDAEIAARLSEMATRSN